MEILNATLRLSTPLLFAAMGGLLCERVGIAALCLEGVMLAAAWVAAVVNFYWQDPWLATLAGMGAGSFIFLLHAFLCISLKANHIISGIAINILALGLTPLLNKALFTSSTNTPSIPMEFRFHSFLNQMPLTYIAFLCAGLVWFCFARTGIGLRLIACGDAPSALETAGVNVKKTRYVTLFFAGLISSLGGIYLSISHASQFTREMTAGRGFIALTAIIFGNWKPLPTLAACLFFGFADSLQIRLQSMELWGTQIPVHFIQMLPYVLTLLVLVGFVGRAQAPLAMGKE